jgi:hypothetical protein
MECPEIKELLNVYVDGEASDGERRAVLSHMEICASCRDAERRMRALGVGVARIEGTVPSDFRDKLFSRLEAEELIPKRRSLFVFSLRWAAIPLAVAAAVGLVLLTGRENLPEKSGTVQVGPRVAQGPVSPRVEEGPPIETSRRIQNVPLSGPAGKAREETAVAARERSEEKALISVRGQGEISAEDREVIAFLDLLEDPAVLEDLGEFDEMEIFAPSGKRKG